MDTVSIIDNQEQSHYIFNVLSWLYADGNFRVMARESDNLEFRLPHTVTRYNDSVVVMVINMQDIKRLILV